MHLIDTLYIVIKDSVIQLRKNNRLYHSNQPALLFRRDWHIMTTAYNFLFFSRERKGQISKKHTLHVVLGPSWPSKIIMKAGYVCKSRGEMVFARLSLPRATNLPVVAWPVPSSASPSPPLHHLFSYYLLCFLSLSLHFFLTCRRHMSSLTTYAKYFYRWIFWLFVPILRKDV